MHSVSIGTKMKKTKKIEKKQKVAENVKTISRATARCLGRGEAAGIYACNATCYIVHAMIVCADARRAC